MNEFNPHIKKIKIPQINMKKGVAENVMTKCKKEFVSFPFFQISILKFNNKTTFFPNISKIKYTCILFPYLYATCHLQLSRFHPITRSYDTQADSH